MLDLWRFLGGLLWCVIFMMGMGGGKSMIGSVELQACLLCDGLRCPPKYRFEMYIGSMGM